ncbi:colanic acid biosynthesis glycosyltransferase WcaL [Moorena producens PAL-8-15-08-1]|uniref:Colanic acid biosynthesis glycosyltransferase WcaL n=1 Tax=Moorena producens PAL-8-15-08-1 TaxID=1458985 RepID=A0A1D8TTV5_9CYAN|nr:glycosyltransferase [Moorena producens]AOX00995.1 colanic acid biosynthesis glycosyltransferase WcaL [Moorena producens PAL-8-15-08-1]
MLKFAFFLGQFPLLSEAFILNQIAGLIERGHQVDIYALHGDTADTSKIHPIVSKYKLFEKTYYAPIIPKNYIVRLLKCLLLLIININKKSWKLLTFLNFFKYGRDAISLRLIYEALTLLPGKSYDIIHCQFGTFGLRGLLFRKVGIIQGKLITTFRGYDISWAIQKYGDHVYDQLLETGDFFLANCDFFRGRVLQLGCPEQKIVVHGSGIDCSKFVFTSRKLPADGKVRIATTGRLVEKKGIEYCIKAVAKLSNTNQNIEFSIVGDGPLRQQFEQLIKELKIYNLVKLLGWKQQQELVKILDNSQIFLAPSVTAADGNQDAPVNTLKEAMAMGLPVISTFHGGIPELVEDGVSGFLVPERDADAIADKLSYLIEHPEIWPEMGKAGRARVEEKYDMEKLNDELVFIYQELLKGELPQQILPEQPVVLHSV